jgi:hypothetical protein
MDFQVLLPQNYLTVSIVASCCGRALDTYERFHIYEITKQSLQLNDNFTETFNPIYDVIIANYQYKQ